MQTEVDEAARKAHSLSKEIEGLEAAIQEYDSKAADGNPHPHVRQSICFFTVSTLGEKKMARSCLHSLLIIYLAP